MALARDLSSLPPASRGDDQDPARPDRQPRFAHLLAEHWAAQHDADRPHAVPGSRIRFSWAGKCAREIAMRVAGAFPTAPMELSGINNVTIGQIVHDAWGDALTGRDDLQVDLEVRCTIDGLDGSGHADALVIADGRRIVLELKTIGGFGFKKSVGARGQAEGPKRPHLLQAALNGLALDADEIVVAYIAKEALSVNEATRQRIDEAGRFTAEWTYAREVYEPIAQREVKRLQRILELLDEQQLAPTAVPDLPPAARVIDPATGRWEWREVDHVRDMGTTWVCGYCPLQEPCRAIGAPGPVPVAEARRRVAEAVR